MMNSDIHPPEKLLDAVVEIAEISVKLPPSKRSLVDSGELHIRSTVLPNGSKEFTVWGLIEYLVFVRETDGSNHVIKYFKADWEAEVYKRLSLYRELGGDAEVREANMISSGMEASKSSKYYPTSGMSVKPQKSVGLRILLAIAAIACGLAVQVFGSIILKFLGLEVLQFITVILGFIVMGYCIYKWSIVGNPNSKGGGFIQKKAKPSISKTNIVSANVEEFQIMQACKMSEEHPEEAAKALEEIAARNPKCASAWASLGYIYMQSGRAKDAEQAYLRTVDLLPKDPAVHLGLSLLYKFALINSKGGLTEWKSDFESITRGLRIPSEFSNLLNQPELPIAYNEITLDALGCSYNYARKMAEVHAREILKVSKDEAYRRAANDSLQEIKMIDTF